MRRMRAHTGHMASLKLSFTPFKKLVNCVFLILNSVLCNVSTILTCSHGALGFRGKKIFHTSDLSFCFSVSVHGSGGSSMFPCSHGSSMFPCGVEGIPVCAWWPAVMYNVHVL